MILGEFRAMFSLKNCSHSTGQKCIYLGKNIYCFFPKASNIIEILRNMIMNLISDILIQLVFLLLKIKIPLCI